MNMVIVPCSPTPLETDAGMRHPEPLDQMRLKKDFPDSAILRQDPQHGAGARVIQIISAPQRLHRIKIPPERWPGLRAVGRPLLECEIPDRRPLGTGAVASVIPVEKRKVHSVAIIMREMRQQRKPVKEGKIGIKNKDLGARKLLVHVLGGVSQNIG